MSVRSFEATGWAEAAALGATADLLDSLDHPGIVTVNEYTPTDSGALLTVQPPGAHVLADQELPGPEHAAAIMAEVAAAVAYLHSERVHLAGVRLDGIDLTAAGRPVLADPRPWRRQGGGEHDAADVASLGRILIRLLRGVRPALPGWQSRLTGHADRSRELNTLGRAAESGRLPRATALAECLRGLGPALTAGESAICR